MKKLLSLLLLSIVIVSLGVLGFITLNNKNSIAKKSSDLIEYKETTSEVFEETQTTEVTPSLETEDSAGNTLGIFSESEIENFTGGNTLISVVTVVDPNAPKN